MKLAIASDHAGYELKEVLKAFLAKEGYEITDFGTNSTESCDYPDYAHPLAEAVETGKVKTGIIICGSGNGVCMTVNKHAGIRGALVWNEELADLAWRHNNANVLCLPARYITLEEGRALTWHFLHAAFEGGRHEKRTDKIAAAVRA